MPGLFSIFNTAKSGLFSQQTAINVTAHNISNAGTDGYSRQRADMVATTPYTMPSMDNAAGAGQLGTGVTVESIERIRDSFLDYQVRVEKGVSGRYTAVNKYLSQVENVLGTDTASSGSGISSLIQKFFSSWQSLSSSSQNVSTVKEQAVQLTNELNHTYSQISDIKTNTNTEIKNVVVQVNGMLEKISKLNQQIKDIKISGQNPNDLLDSRDLLLDQLSSEFGISITDKDYDGIDVTTSNSASNEGDNGSAPLLNGKPINIVQSADPNNTDVASFSYITSIVNKGNIPVGSKNECLGTDGNNYTIDSSGNLYDSSGVNQVKIDIHGNTVAVTVNSNGEIVDASNNKYSISSGKLQMINSNTDTFTVQKLSTYEVDYCKKGDTLTSANEVKIYVNMTSDQEKQLSENRVLWCNNSGTAYEVDGSGNVAVNGSNAITLDGSANAASTNPINFSQLAIFKPPTGELKGYASVQKNIDDYQDELNKFAKSLALSVNGIISQSDTWVKDNPTDGSAEGGINNFFVNGDKKGNFSAADENNITAGNITVNMAIVNDPSKIKVGTKYDSNGNSLSADTDGNRAVAVAQLANSIMNIRNVTTDSSRRDLLNGIFTSNDKLNNVYSVGKVNGGSTLDNYFNDLVNKIGSHEQEAKEAVDTESVQLQSYMQSREAKSGVSIDEEMTNLIQYQHCYQANAKMISTVDELLDVVVNQLKR